MNTAFHWCSQLTFCQTKADSSQIVNKPPTDIKYEHRKLSSYKDQKTTSSNNFSHSIINRKITGNNENSRIELSANKKHSQFSANNEHIKLSANTETFNIDSNTSWI